MGYKEPKKTVNGITYLRSTKYFTDPVTGKWTQKDFHVRIGKHVFEEDKLAVEKKYQDYIAKRQAVASANAYLAKQSTTLETKIYKWIKYFKTSASERTRSDYDGYVHDWIAPHIGHMQVEDVTIDDVQRIFVAMASKSGSTKKHIRGLLHCFFRHLIIKREVKYNPVDGVEMFKANPPDVNPPPVSDIKSVLARMDEKSDDRNSLSAYIAFALGNRRSEIAGIHIESIDFENNTVYLCRKVVFTNVKTKEYKSYEKMKNNKSKRWVDFDQWLADKIKEYISTHTFIKHPVDGVTYLFQDDKGNYLNPDCLGNAYRCMAKRMKVRGKQGIHQLRHSQANVLKAAKVDPYLIKERLGHALLSTTEKYYFKNNQQENKNRGLGKIHTQHTE